MNNQNIYYYTSGKLPLTMKNTLQVTGKDTIKTMHT